MLVKENQHIFILGITILLLPFLVLFAYTEHRIYLTIPFAFLLFYYGWQSVSFIYLLLVASLPWSAEISMDSSYSTDFPDELLMLLVATLYVAMIFYKRRLVSTVEWRHPLLWLVLLHVGWIIFTTSTSTHVIISLKYFLAKSWYIIAFLWVPMLILQHKRQLKIMVLVFSGSLLAVALVIMARHSLNDFLFIHINDAVSPFFRNHVNYSAMLVCGLPIGIAMFRLTISSIFYRRLILVALFLVVIALILAFSRGAWLAIITGLVAYLLLKYRILWQTFVVWVLITVLTIFWLKSNDRYLSFAHDYKTTIFHTDFKEHIRATYQLKDVSTAERFNRWIAAVRMVPDKPLVGFGPGTFSNNYRPYTIPAFKTWVSDNKEKSTVHNYFLLMITEQGWPGLLFFLLLLTAIFYYAQHIFYRLRDPFYKEMVMAIASIMVMIITLNFLSDLIETDKIGSLFFSCIALLIIADRQLKTESKINMPNV